MKAEIAYARLAEVPNEVRDQMMRHRAVLPAWDLELGPTPAIVRTRCEEDATEVCRRGL